MNLLRATLSFMAAGIAISPASKARIICTFDMTNRLTEVGALPNGWDVHGKTGTGSPPKADGSFDQARAYGWFVGWAKKGPRTIVFARLIQDEQEERVSAGLRARAAFLDELPALLGAL